MSTTHWSYSALSTYQRCSLRYFFQYVLALPQRSIPSALALGAATHEGLAVYHRALLEG